MMEKEKYYGYTVNQWMMALLDILDGSSTPNEIRYNSGLPIERCEEISQMYNDATKAGWPQREQQA